MPKTRIYITQPIAQSAIDRLKARGDVELKINPDATKILPYETLMEEVKNCDILYCLLHDVVDKAIMQSNPNLKAVASQSITPDRIDVKGATEIGMPVTVIPAVVTDATADIAFGLLLCVARRIVEADKFVRAGGYPGAQSALFLGGDVSGKTLGLVGGRGRIGKATGVRGKGFGMKVLYWGPNKMTPEDEKEYGFEYVEFDEIFEQSDFVSVHAAERPETKHLISDREFKLMKKSAYIVNSARGPIIDEKAMVRALQNKEIAGAGLDVYENEPIIEKELFEMDNVVLAPHLGSAGKDVREGMAHRVVDNIEALIDGKTPPNCANPETLK
tara:strand:+ start:1692 stop:2681 length:990 start_codon:yes stop_codon:yes gene_type:complete